MADWELIEEALNLFLSWLDPDRDAAGRKYEALRRRLVVMFDARRCTRSEELADETLNRFIRRLPAMLDSFNGDPISYLLVVAHRLHLEYIETQTLPLPDDVAEIPAGGGTPGPEVERFHQCLEACLGKLESNARDLVLDYYRWDKRAKIDFRRKLAERLGLTSNALRIKVHHLRAVLRDCVEDCLGPELPEMK